MAKTPVAILYKADGSVAVSVLNDGSVERLAVDAKGSVSIVPPFAASGLGSLFRKFLAESGGNESLVVNGSITAKVFKVDADSTKDILLTEIRILMTAGIIEMNSVSFGKGGGSLTNGILIEVTSGGVTTEIGNIKINEDILMLPVRNDVLFNQVPLNDVLALSMDFGGVVKLVAGSGDNVKITVRDDLTGGVRGIEYFKSAAYGVKE